MSRDEGDWEWVVGEFIGIAERLVLSPCQGRLSCLGEVVEGEYVEKGQMIARVFSVAGEVVPVLTDFSGHVCGFLLPNASPVRRCEPVAWILQEDPMGELADQGG